MSEDGFVPIEDALARLYVIPDYDPGGKGGPRPCVHTFSGGGGLAIGAHWDMESAEAFMREHGVRESGGSAAAMHHGLVVSGDGRTIFFETKADDDGGEG